MKNTIIKANNAIDTIFDLTNLPNASVVTIEDLRLDGNSKAANCVDSSTVETAPSLHNFNRVWFVGATNNLVNVTNREGTTFNGCVFGESGSTTPVGLRCDNLGGLLRLNDCLFQYLTEKHVSFKGAELYCRGCSFGGDEYT